MPLEKLIRRPVQTLPPEATCTQAAVLMGEENIGAVVVADAGRPLGIVTDRDIAVRVVAQGQDPEQTQLRDVMSGDPVFLRRERGIDQAISSMRDLAVRRIPIVDEEGQLQGLIALDDLIILLSEQLGSLAQAIRKEAEPPT